MNETKHYLLNNLFHLSRILSSLKTCILLALEDFHIQIKVFPILLSIFWLQLNESQLPPWIVWKPSLIQTCLICHEVNYKWTFLALLILSKTLLLLSAFIGYISLMWSIMRSTEFDPNESSWLLSFSNKILLAKSSEMSSR